MSKRRIRNDTTVSVTVGDTTFQRSLRPSERRTMQSPKTLSTTPATSTNVKPPKTLDIVEIERKAQVLAAMDTEPLPDTLQERLLLLTGDELVNYFQTSSLSPIARAKLLARMAKLLG